MQRHKTMTYKALTHWREHWKYKFVLFDIIYLVYIQNGSEAINASFWHNIGLMSQSNSRSASFASSL